jgi:flagellar hook-associated protein 2
MTDISSLGGGASGSITGQLDVQWIVEQIIYAKQQPIRDLETYEFFYEAKKEAFQELNTKVSALESALYNVNIGGFETRSATLSTEDYLTASATATASTGDYSIIVEQLAAAQSETSDSFSSADDQLLQNGTVTIKNYDGSEVLGEVDFSAGTLSLNDLSNEINSLGLDITATVVNFGSESTPAYRIQLTADDTGTENGFTIDETDAGGGTLPNFATTISAADAYLYVNTDASDPAYRIIRASNTVSDVINGVTLNLNDADINETTTLTVASDPTNLKENIQSFVDAFNEVVDFLNAQFEFDEENERAGVLSGEAAARKVKNDLLSLATSRVDGIDSSDSYNSFSIIGLELNRVGQLEINDDKLDDAIADHLDSVKRIFRDVGTTSHSEVSYVTGTDDTTAGTYNVFVTQAAEQARAQSDTNIAATLGQDETLTITYSGADYTVDLTSGMTNTEVVAAINAAMDDEGISVYSQVSGSKLQILTDNYGSSESVTVVSDVAKGSGGTGIGTTAVSDSGLDVAGKYEKDSVEYAASGSGRTLTGTAGEAEGLKTYVTTSTVTDTVNGDDKGTVYFTRGVGEALRERMYETSFPYSGLIAKNIEALDNQLENIADKISAINRQLEAEQEILILQFTKANEALAQMTYLQSTLGNNFLKT